MATANTSTYETGIRPTCEREFLASHQPSPTSCITKYYKTQWLSGAIVNPDLILNTLGNQEDAV